MYEKIKTTINGINYRYAVIGGIVLLSVFCCWYIFHEPNGSNNHDSLNTVERIEKQQRESLELNRDIQHAIDRGSDLSHEAKERIDRSTQYNIDIGNRIDESKNAIMKQEVTLNEMSNSLTELKGQIENDKRTIKRLRMQRNLSQMVGAGAIIGVVIHR